MGSTLWAGKLLGSGVVWGIALDTTAAVGGGFGTICTGGMFLGTEAIIWGML